ncbi:uncharacterized protein C19orf44-like isoform X2 [Haliotis asinina]|uniref:uncharacterized protein C19orf44-like isoform X2 n=1 Tax=Haliotis asinina TaxID=109174 RepID=UPI0035324A55
MTRMSRASSILQRVNSQLRGERVPIKSKEEDELSTYLSTLAQKTGQASKSVNFEDFGENISISSESNLQKTPRGRTGTPPLGQAASRFLKKKKPDTDEVDQSNVTTPNMSPRGPRRSYRPATSVPNASPQKSTPLAKAKAITNKINDRAVVSNKRGTYFETDTDDSVSLANYMQYASADQLKSASEKSVGRDGNRFLKKTKAEKPFEEGENVYMEKIEAPRPSSPAKGQRRPFADRDTSKPTGTAVPEYANKGQVKYQGNFHLTSEEESMADFINRLSSADDAKRKKKTKRSRGHDLPSSDLSLMRTPSPPTQTPRRVPSPIYGRRLSRSPSQDSDNVDSIHSEVADTQETESSGNIFNTVNLMDLDSLEPLALSPEPSEKKKEKKKSSKKKSELKESKSKTKQKSKESSSVFKASVKENIFKAKGPSKKSKEPPHKTDSVFNNLGLHTVDELLGVSEAKEESIASEVSEIVTEKSDIFAARKRKDSMSSIATEIGVDTPQHQMYSEDFDEDSISERIGQDSVQGGKQVRWTVESEVKTEYSDENTQADYDDDFETDSRGRSYTDRTYQSDSEGYTSDTETYTHSYTDSRQDMPPPKSRKETKSVEIQTSTDPGLNYRWNLMSSGLAISGPSLGLGFVDPTPIASHVVSADALEAMTSYSPCMTHLYVSVAMILYSSCMRCLYVPVAMTSYCPYRTHLYVLVVITLNSPCMTHLYAPVAMTSYSPCMLALHDLMKQQLVLTQNFLETQRQMYESSTSVLKDSYKYTTLEDTQEYIRKHRKPRLSFKKALKMVSREMNM